MSALITLSVLTLNIWGLPDLGFKILAPLREERVDGICRLLETNAKEKSGWDVVLLQEVWLQRNRRTLRNCGYPFFAEREDPSVPLDSGLMILSRYPIEAVERLSYPGPPQDEEGLETGEGLARKSALYAKIKYPEGESIWVGNTHLISKYDSTNDKYAPYRRSQFRRFMERALFLSGEEPLVLGGDWNFGRRDLLWDEVADSLKGFVEGPEAIDACTVCPPNTMHVTDEGKIDHLFARNPTTAKNGKIAAEKPLTIEGFQISLSDHFGWETRFQW